MATHSRLRIRSELKTKALFKSTFRSFLLYATGLLSILIVVVVLTWDGTHSKDEVSIGVLMVLARGHLLVPIRSAP